MERGRYIFKVRSYECGPDGRATLPTICNFLQEAASLHADSLGFGKGDFAAAGENISWVLTRMVVKMNRYPVWEDELTVETFPRGGRKIVAWRDFEIRDAKGQTLGVASSEWMIIDLSTRKIHAIPEKVFAANDPANVPVLGLEPFAKFRFPDTGKLFDCSDCSDCSIERSKAMTFTAQKSQIDLNGHVNNVHYINWMLEPCESRCPAEMEIVFRSETLAGDEVCVETAAADGWTYHRVFAPDGKDHVVARTKD